MYFVTLVTRQRKNYFQKKKHVVEGLLSDTAIGLNGVSIDTKIIMPNHVHVIFLLNGSTIPLGEIVRKFKAKVSHLFGQSVWQPNYYEHIIRTERALDRIREYIMYNPELEITKFDQFYT